MPFENSANEKYLYMRLEELMRKRNISKNRLCKDLDMQMTNLNKYYRNQFQRIDAALIVKLCDYFQCEVSELLEIREVLEPDNVLPVFRKNHP